MAKLVEFLGKLQSPQSIPKHFDVIAEGFHGLRRTKLTKLSTERSYYLTGFLAKLEQALVRYTTSVLKNRGFEFVSVPDILEPAVLEACGMAKGQHNIVYDLDQRHGQWTLSGTAEMALAALYKNKSISVAEPKKLCAVSRCYRAEVTDVQEGLYRVHEFTKVEMFGCCLPDHSSLLLNEFLNIQKYIVNSLQLHAKVLDMPEDELGLSASQKFDIEAWMPGHKKFGEISSTSNCTNYQSSRLNITSTESAGSDFVHTVNGTACAVPRMLIALLEQHQQMDGAVWIPPVLRQYFQRKEVMLKEQKKIGGTYWRPFKKDRVVV